MARFAILLLISGLAFGQVAVTYSPLPMVSVKAVGIKDVGPWSIYACNNGVQAVTLPPERFYMAATGIRFIDAAHVRLLVPAQQAQTFWGRLETGVNVAGLGTTIGLGLAKSNPRAIAVVGIVQFVITPIVNWIKGEKPDAKPYMLDLLDAPVRLEAGICATRSGFAAKMKNPQRVDVMLGP